MTVHIGFKQILLYMATYGTQASLHHHLCIFVGNSALGWAQRCMGISSWRGLPLHSILPAGACVALWLAIYYFTDFIEAAPVGGSSGRYIFYYRLIVIVKFIILIIW